MPRTGLSGRAEWVWEARFWMVGGNCDLLLAALGPNVIRASPFFLMGSFGFLVVDNSDWGVSAVPIVRDAVLIVARRADTWDSPYRQGRSDVLF
ncbi:hypothetical protein [Gimesia maris]|uniref:hypothetical protein n=1 Tax=Gimesia maris TaxID=122 RepID=UPI0018D93192|nr:hypothetical protein [Gimesia maris]